MIWPSKEGIVDWSRTTFHFPHAIPRGYQGKWDRPTRAWHLSTPTMEHTCNQSFWKLNFLLHRPHWRFAHGIYLGIVMTASSGDLNDEALLYDMALSKEAIVDPSTTTFHFSHAMPSGCRAKCDRMWLHKRSKLATKLEWIWKPIISKPIPYLEGMVGRK